MNQLQPVRETNSLDSTGVFTQKITDRLSLRIYKDSRPNYLETGTLQKGLVLLLDGIELIEEGMGFGVPVIKYKDKTFFSSKADSSIGKSGADIIMTKVFILDTISLKKFGNATYIDDAVYSPFRKTFEKLYLKHKKLMPLFNKVMEVRDLANVKTEFVKVKPRGKVTITYHCQPTTVDINADFSEIVLDKCCEVLILNEQGSSFFRRYVDSNGLNLLDQKIGAWETVTADQASLQEVRGQVTFCLENCGGVRFFRGWEHTRNRFSWAGLSYSMRPTNGSFKYRIKLNLKSE